MEDTGKTIALIKALGGGGSGGLPPVTESDAGKVLSVNNSGVWGAESEVFYFDVAYDSSDDSYTAQTVNREELVDAINKGKRFAMRYTDGNHLTTIIDVQSFGESRTLKSERSLFIGEATISDYSITGFTTIYLTASVSPDEDPSVTETAVAALIVNHDRFIVTLTPTSPDYSGTMDKTVAEINAAYEAGQEIWFKVLLSATDYLEGALTAVRHSGSHSYDDYIGNIVLPSEGMLITVETLGTDDGTKQTYSTHVYSLTPAS